jgi:hypothetical protein
MIVPNSIVDKDDVARAVGALAAEHGGAVTVAQLRDKLGSPSALCSEPSAAW